MQTQNKVFLFDKISVYFKHTDYHGFVHPYNYFEWTSYVREAFFQETVFNFDEVLSRPIKMMTTRIMLETAQDASFGNLVEARLSVSKIKRVSFDMNIDFFNLTRQQLSANTTHSIVFVDSEKASFARIPDEMQRVILDYQKNTEKV
ncbi:MAG: hypothetical protein EXS63_06035 [Candidatus Omnitrophica bacterium]|nr:hypothetical protein [Candidatus Omnitrophota bacterium]